MLGMVHWLGIIRDSSARRMIGEVVKTTGQGGSFGTAFRNLLNNQCNPSQAGCQITGSKNEKAVEKSTACF
jgi:hypothetical protein